MTSHPAFFHSREYHTPSDCICQVPQGRKLSTPVSTMHQAPISTPVSTSTMHHVISPSHGITQHALVYNTDNHPTSDYPCQMVTYSVTICYHQMSTAVSRMNRVTDSFRWYQIKGIIVYARFVPTYYCR